MKQTAMHTTSPWASPELQPGVTAAVIISGLFMIAFGVWAFFAPASFAEFVAFPYSRHLLHDVGAFQIGIGATVLLALVWADSIMVVLGGFVVGGSFHLASHIVDRHIGGHSYDALVLGFLIVIGLAGMYARARAERRAPGERV
jgi:hypothetical protein